MRNYLARSAATNLRQLEQRFDTLAHRQARRRTRRHATLAGLCAQEAALIDSCRILLQSGRGVPATVLARTILEAGLWVSFICAGKSNDDRSRHYHAAAAASARKLEGALLGPGSPLTDAEKRSFENLRDDPSQNRFLNYKLRKDPQAGPNIDYMIARLRNDDEKRGYKYLYAYVYRVGSNYVHAGASAANPYLSPQGVRSTRPSRSHCLETYVTVVGIGHIVLKSLEQISGFEDARAGLTMPRHLKAKRRLDYLWSRQ